MTITAPQITLDEIIVNPLPDVLARLDIEVIEDQAPTRHGARGWIGNPAGRIVVIVPADEDPVVRDVEVRGLIAAYLGLDTSSWPSRMEFVQVIRDGQDVL